METATVDWTARAIALSGLAVAILVACVQVLTYRRGRQETAHLAVNVETFAGVVSGMIVLHVQLLNQSYKPNTVIELKACAARFRWPFSRIQCHRLGIGNLALSPRSSGWLSLAVNPIVELSPHTWTRLAPTGVLPREALWRLPLFLREASSTALFLAVFSDQPFAKNARITVTAKDIMGGRYRGRLSLSAE